MAANYHLVRICRMNGEDVNLYFNLSDREERINDN